MSITPYTPEKKQKSALSRYATFVLGVLAAVAVGFFFSWPQYQALQATNAQLTTDQGNLAQLQVKSSAYHKSLNALQATNLDAIDQAIPKKDNTTDLYAYIETLVNASGLTFMSVQVTETAAPVAAAPAAAVISTDSTSAAAAPSTPLPLSTPAAGGVPAGIGEVKIQLGVTGTSAQFAQLLTSFQNSLRLIDVQSIGVSGGSSSGESFTVTALTYYQQ